ncbi:unnamed protein product [Euphydryas editha]|uniref:Uncharacterized protein n=1 Tax=Euphydryas editha TaxID=104508 RepID=A0AAU9TYH2_EUPED|nr:unnamed protein product [Euphydryas editha]
MMQYFYGVAQGVAREVARLNRKFAERQPGPAVQHFPDHRVFMRLHNFFLEGVIPSFRGREPGRVNRDDEDVILEELRRDPTTSQRQLARRTGDCVRKSTSERNLRRKIQVAIRAIIQNRQSGWANRLRRNFLRRCRLCLVKGGRHFEILL